MGSLTNIFGTVWQKIFDGNSWYFQLLSLIILDARNFPKHWWVHLRFLWHCETKNIRRKIVLFLAFLSLKFFDGRNFPKHWWVHLRIFSVLWNKKHLTENRDPFPSYLQIFSIPEDFQNNDGFTYDFFPNCETKQSCRNFFCRNTKEIPWKFFAMWDKKFLTENLDAPPLILKVFR